MEKVRPFKTFLTNSEIRSFAQRYAVDGDNVFVAVPLEVYEEMRRALEYAKSQYYMHDEDIKAKALNNILADSEVG
jgi:hypothetical protein